MALCLASLHGNNLEKCIAATRQRGVPSAACGRVLHLWVLAKSDSPELRHGYLISNHPVCSFYPAPPMPIVAPTPSDTSLSLQTSRAVAVLLNQVDNYFSQCLMM
ncbi:hypothetical protein GOP47_0030253 [Adiantum capillus-veneris]|nr:hypothetical protein GOP47_0030253 [Adiantum capillus-veneris]